ncbi:MAG: HD domain-containing protein [Candidatus Brockarchaeota archaeon]|nr:HD domain-containing protein [Candidatus Brockarchaeota archaeon]MBO3768395.1 HD domain-containing protein [Candidatus Brockarchaeota archaeon]
MNYKETKIRKDYLKKVIEYARRKTRSSDLAHRFDHAECVARNAIRISKREKVDLEIVLVAAYLHDIVSRRESKNKPHHVASAERAKIVLKKIGYDEDFIKKVYDAIVEASYESWISGIKPRSREAKVLHDADLLEAMGARGIARAFAFAGAYDSRELGEVNFDLKHPPKSIARESIVDPSPISHFASKLLHLRNMILTRSGKKMAKEKHEFMIKFLKQYKKEMS